MGKLRIESREIMAAGIGKVNPLAPILPNQKGFYWQLKNRRRPREKSAQPVRRPFPRCSLPYGYQDQFNRNVKLRKFKVAVLENEILRATFLPTLGGRLWSLYHKPSRKELLHISPILQPTNIAFRGAWFSGGVEWNIGVLGHSPLTCSPMFAAKVVKQNGDEILRLYEYERIRNVFFQMDFALPKGASVLHAFVRIINPNTRKTPMYWWSNAAVPEDPAMRVVAPASHSISWNYGGNKISRRVPLSHGLDCSRPGTIPSAHDFYFKLKKGKRPWIAAFSKKGLGYFQSSTQELVGRKLFVWGMGPGGRNWQKFLGRASSPYVELQAGLAPTQFEYISMPARSELSWLEVYGQVKSDPKVVHGQDWQKARSAAESSIEKIIPGKILESKLADMKASADIPPEKMLNKGSGWGALALMKMADSNDSFLLPSGMKFPISSLGKKQKPWVTLLRKGHFPSQPDNSGTWMCKAEWGRILEKAIKSNSKKNGVAWLNMGIIYTGLRKYRNAEASWRRALRLKPSSNTCRNLGALGILEKKFNVALGWYQKALKLDPTLAPLVIEFCKTLNAIGNSRLLLERYNNFPARIRRHPRVKMNRIHALISIGELDKADNLLQNHPFDLVDMREGENDLTFLWYWLKAKQHLKGKEVFQGDRRFFGKLQVKLPPPPAWMDFRFKAHPGE